MTLRHYGLRVLLSGALLALPTATHARERPTRVILLLPACPRDSPIAGVREALSVELDARGMRVESAESGFAKGDVLVEVEANCEFSSDPLTVRAIWLKEQRERELELVDVPAHTRARAIALSIAELVDFVVEHARNEMDSTDEGSEPELKPTSTPAAPKRVPPTTAAEARIGEGAGWVEPARGRGTISDRPPALSATPRSRRVLLASEGRWFVGGQPLWGGRAVLQVERFMIGIDLLAGESRTPAGTVSGSMLHGLLAYRVTEAETARWLLAWGPRMGLGVVRAEGLPSTPAPGSVAAYSGRVLETYLDAAAFGLVELGLGRETRLGAGVEFGYARGLIALADGVRAGVYGGVLGGTYLSLAIGL